MLVSVSALLRRDEIIDVIKRCYYVKKQKNVPIFYITNKDLRDFTTTEKDMKKEYSRFPTPNYRTTEEDLFDSGLNTTSASTVSTANSAEGGMFQNASSGEADLVAQQAVRGK